MARSKNSLDKLCGGKTPKDLESFFKRTADGELAGAEFVEVNVLPLDDAAELSADFRGFHPVVKHLGGVVLDDANTSNHHVYLTAPECAGAVLYLSHDGDAKIVFANLEEFESACRKAKESEEPLTMLHPEAGLKLPDQKGLFGLIKRLTTTQRKAEGIAAALALIPSSDLSEFEFFAGLAKDDDFYLGEAIGNAIAWRPRKDLAPLAELCASHPHFQAKEAGQRALAAIKKLN